MRDVLPETSLAASSGIHRVQGVIKLLLAGADITMMASVLLKKGPAAISKIATELQTWLDENEYDSVTQLKGSMSQGNCPDPSALERANYMKTLTSYTWQPSRLDESQQPPA